MGVLQIVASSLQIYVSCKKQKAIRICRIREFAKLKDAYNGLFILFTESVIPCVLCGLMLSERFLITKFFHKNRSGLNIAQIQLTHYV
jgi:hypothetical protein